MPQRFLKPGIKDSMRFNQCSWPAQSLFVRLITVVDDYGRYDAHPLALARILFPFGRPADNKPVQEKDVAKWLDELSRRGLVLLYRVAGDHYLQMTRWTERIRSVHQRFPAPPANMREQMLAEDSKCLLALAGVGAVTTNAASPTSPTSTTSTSATIEKNSVDGGPSMAQFAALKARIEAAAKDPDASGKSVLKKMRAALDHIQKKQAAGDFSLTDLSQFGLTNE